MLLIRISWRNPMMKLMICERAYLRIFLLAAALVQIELWELGMVTRAVVVLVVKSEVSGKGKLVARLVEYSYLTCLVTY